MMAPSNTTLWSISGDGDRSDDRERNGRDLGDAVISDGGATVTLRNVLVDKMIEEGLKDTYRYTNHKVKDHRCYGRYAH